MRQRANGGRDSRCRQVHPSCRQEPLKRDENRFFSAQLAYPSMFDTGRGLRPHIRVEMSMVLPSLPPIARPIRSLVALAQKQPPEVPTFLCVDPVETAADKLSALAWRVHARRRGSDNDDPTIIRHLHDLAALRPAVAAASDFVFRHGSKRAISGLHEDPVKAAPIEGQQVSGVTLI
jgi:hypothetical protein